MVAKYSKTKGYKPTHVDQARMEQEKARRVQEEFKAYQRLLRETGNNPVPSHYRTTNGHHMKIAPSEGSWERQNVSEEEQQLPPGYAWVPFPPLAPVGTVATVQQFFMSDPLVYLAVKPQQVGFNDLGEYIDEFGAWYKSYQLQQLVVIEPAPQTYDYEAVTSHVFDPSREHIRIYQDGRIACVAPIPQGMGYDLPVAPVQLQPVPIPQAPGLELQQPLLEQAPQQMPELQILVDGSNSTPESGASFNSAATPDVPKNVETVTNGVTQEDGNAGFDNFDPNDFNIPELNFDDFLDMDFE